MYLLFDILKTLISWVSPAQPGISAEEGKHLYSAILHNPLCSWKWNRGHVIYLTITLILWFFRAKLGFIAWFTWEGVHISFLQLFLDTHETNISKLPVKTNISDKYLFLRNHMCDGITWLECLYMILYKVYFLFVDWKSKMVTTIGEGLCFRLLRPKGHVSFSQHLVSAVCLFYNVNFSDLDVLWNHNQIKPNFDGKVLEQSPITIVSNSPTLYSKYYCCC